MSYRNDQRRRTRTLNRVRHPGQEDKDRVERMLPYLPALPTLVIGIFILWQIYLFVTKN